MRLIINGHDFDWEFELALARIEDRNRRRIADALATFRYGHLYRRSAGQILRRMRERDFKQMGVSDDGVER